MEAYSKAKKQLLKKAFDVQEENHRFDLARIANDNQRTTTELKQCLTDTENKLNQEKGRTAGLNAKLTTSNKRREQQLAHFTQTVNNLKEEHKQQIEAISAVAETRARQRWKAHHLELASIKNRHEVDTAARNEQIEADWKETHQMREKMKEMDCLSHDQAWEIAELTAAVRKQRDEMEDMEDPLWWEPTDSALPPHGVTVSVTDDLHAIINDQRRRQGQYELQMVSMEKAYNELAASKEMAAQAEKSKDMRIQDTLKDIRHQLARIAPSPSPPSSTGYEIRSPTVKDCFKDVDGTSSREKRQRTGGR